MALSQNVPAQARSPAVLAVVTTLSPWSAIRLGPTRIVLSYSRIKSMTSWVVPEEGESSTSPDCKNQSAHGRHRHHTARHVRPGAHKYARKVQTRAQVTNTVRESPGEVVASRVPGGGPGDGNRGMASDCKHQSVTTHCDSHSTVTAQSQHSHSTVTAQSQRVKRDGIGLQAPVSTQSAYNPHTIRTGTT